MKKSILFFGLFLASFCLSNVANAQKDTMTLYRPEIKEMLQIVKQNTIYDTVDVQKKVRSIKNLQDALALNTPTATVIVEREYVFDYMERHLFEYEQYQRSLEARNKFLRVANALYLRNPKLPMLKADALNTNTDHRYSRLADLRMDLLRDLKYENTIRNTINGADEAKKAALIITDN